MEGSAGSVPVEGKGRARRRKCSPPECVVWRRPGRRRDAVFGAEIDPVQSNTDGRRHGVNQRKYSSLAAGQQPITAPVIGRFVTKRCVRRALVGWMDEAPRVEAREGHGRVNGLRHAQRRAAFENDSPGAAGLHYALHLRCTLCRCARRQRHRPSAGQTMALKTVPAISARSKKSTKINLLFIFSPFFFCL